MLMLSQLLRNTAVQSINTRFRYLCNSMANSRAERIIWIDLEMGGLEVEEQPIVEIACLVTEADLTAVGKGLDIVISHPEAVIKNMNEWCLKTFSANGLIDEIRRSSITMKEAENMVLEYVKEHTDKKKCPVGGNSVNYDREFICKYMPDLAQHFNYRTIDVSSIKEIVKRWMPDKFAKNPKKKGEHRAMGDILESIEELKWYKENVFLPH